MSLRPLVWTIAKRLVRRGELIEDLIADGLVGALRAIRRFDRTKGYKLETFAGYCIRGEILEGRRQRNETRKRYRIRTVRLSVRSRGEYSPSDGFAGEDIDTASDAAYSRWLAVRKRETVLDVDRLLGWLQPAEQRVLADHFLHGKKQVEIARELGVTEGYISQLLKRALDYLRSQVRFAT